MLSVAGERWQRETDKNTETGKQWSLTDKNRQVKQSRREMMDRKIILTWHQYAADKSSYGNSQNDRKKVKTLNMDENK